MTVRNLGHQALAAERTAVETREFRVGSRFIDKDQLLGVEMSLPESPQHTPLSNVRPILFRSVQDFF